LARLSKRSLYAVLCFFSVAVFVATALQQMGLQVPSDARTRSTSSGLNLGTILSGMLLLAVASHLWMAINGNKTDSVHFIDNLHYRKLLPSAVSGALFATGLSVSGMANPEKVGAFLNMGGITDHTFDPTLVFVMVGGLLVSFASYQFVSEFNVVKVSAATFSCTRPCSLAEKMNTLLCSHTPFFTESQSSAMSPFSDFLEER